MIPNSDQLRSLRLALQTSPDNVPLRQLVAELLLSMGEAEGAELEFKTAIALDSANLELKLGLARCYYQLGQDQQALKVLADLLKQDPTHTEALALNAKVMLRAGQTDQAIEQFRQSLLQDEAFQNAEAASAEKVFAYGTASESILETDAYVLERPQITFADVGGMESLKEEIRLKIIYPMTHAEMYQAYGQSIGGGILMYGPPGCGKTHIARATAGEIRAGFITVAISDVLDMYLGNSEKNLHDIFTQARQNTPCVLFFDEVDALAARRTDMIHSGGRHVINQFLTELDGVQYSNEGVLILAATNTPWYLDSAFRRPGRFDRILFVQPPDGPARTAVLRLICKGKPQQEIDFDQVSKKTSQFSGADLKAVVDRAVEQKLRDAMKTGVPQPLTTKDLLRSAKAVNPSTKEWFSTARNYATHANQDGTYDDILSYLKRS